MFKQVTGSAGLLGLIMGAAFLPYECMNRALPALIPTLILGKDNDNASASFSNGTIFFNSTDYLNSGCSDFDYRVITHPDVYVEGKNQSDLISFGFDYTHLVDPVLAIKPKKETDEESNIAALATKLGDVLKGAANVVSGNGAVILGAGYFFKDSMRYGPKPALFNTVQGYVEVPAILHYFESYVDSGIACAAALANNALTTVAPYWDEYAAPLAKSYVEFGIDAVLNKENQQLAFDLLEQAGEYVPSFSKIAKLGIGAGLRLGLGKVIAWYKKIDVSSRV